MRYDLDSGESVQRRYWELPDPAIETDRSEDEWLGEIWDTLVDATRIRLRSDVPVGVFLSGGIDSGLVTAATSQLQPITALTIGFDGTAEDETELAKATAQHLGVQQKVQQSTLGDIDMLSQLVSHFDEPFADSSLLPTAMVSALARESFTVILSGDGGDELFAGYNHHLRAWNWRHVANLPLNLRQKVATPLIDRVPADSIYRRFLRRFGQPVGTFGLGGLIYPFEDWIAPILHETYHLDHHTVASSLTNQLVIESADPLDQAQRFDMQLFMVDDILVKVDRMSMYHSLEVRAPLLDYRLLELGLRIPTDLRTKNGQSKYLLRQLAARHLPPQIARAPKSGFSIPLHDWLFSNPKTPQLKELLMTPAAGFPDPLRRDRLMSFWNQAEANPALNYAMFRLLAFRWWTHGQA